MVIRFNKKLYKQKPIKAAIRSFGEVADFNFSKKDNYYSIELYNPREYPADVIKDEFCNYVLQLMKTGG